MGFAWTKVYTILPPKWRTYSIPTSTQYVNLPKYFSQPSLVIYFFATPPMKLKRGPQMWELLIANHLDQSLWLANPKQGAAVRSYLLHSSLAGVQLCCAFYQPQQTKHICRGKTIFQSQHQQMLLSSSNFNVQGHILCTGGDAQTEESKKV
jgi:hypothetical protein